MSALLIDAGNTRIKWRYRDSDGRVQRGACLHGDIGTVDWSLMLADIGSDLVMVASVNDNEALRCHLARQSSAQLRWIGEPLVSEAVEFRHCYPEPGRLGVDRWLAMLGGRCYHRGALLVIDAGTALTVDFLTADNHHDGGYIVPGLDLMQQALWRNTRRVIAYADEHDASMLVPGKDTRGCVSAGTRRMQLAFVENVIAGFPDYQPIITGGDGGWLARELNLEYRPELVLDGLETLCAGYSSR